MQLSAANFLGKGQSWQDETLNRAYFVTYTNTTGRTIAVSMNTANVSPGFSVIGFVDGQKVLQHTQGSATTKRLMTTFIVPPGSTYEVQTSGASPGAIENWAELK